VPFSAVFCVAAAFRGALSSFGKCLCLLALLQAAFPARAQRLAAGERNVLAIRPDGTLWGWGANEHGELGDGTTTQRIRPIRVGEATDWVSVTTDKDATLATRADGSRWQWGGYYADAGPRGYPDSVWRRDPASLRPLPTGPASPWKQELKGSLFLKADGTLWVPDENAEAPEGSEAINKRAFTRLGTSTWKDIVGIKPSSQPYVVAINTNGTLWIWETGYHYAGCRCYGKPTQADTIPHQLGTRTWKSITAAGRNIAAVATDGTLWAFKYDSGIMSKTLVQVGTSTWRTINGSDEHFIGIRTDGSLWLWGSHFDYGSYASGITGELLKYHGAPPQQLGVDTTWQHVAAGPDYVVAMRRDGTVEAWGSNRYGQLGDPARGPVQLTVPTQLGTATSWKGVSLGLNHGVAWRTDGTLWAWGRNEYGQLGDNSCTPQAQPVQVGRSTNWKSASASDFFTAALRQDGSLWTWGSNDFGKLGNGVSKEVFAAKPTKLSTAHWKNVSTSAAHCVALRQDGSLWGWGSAGYGALGDPRIRSYNFPVLRPSRITPGTTWKHVVAAGSHTIGVRADGTLSGWGCFSDTGPTDLSSSAVPGRKWQTATGGVDYLLLLQTDGTLWAMGRNVEGQLGIDRRVAKKEAWDSGLTYTRFSTSFVPVAPGTHWISVAAGYYHTLAVRADGTLWAWGKNESGELGLGYSSMKAENRFPTQIGTATDWKSVAATDGYSAAIKTDGTLWVWGYMSRVPSF